MKRSTPQLRVGVLASGAGTNLQAIIDASEKGSLPAVVAVVIADRTDAGALKRAAHHHIPAVLHRRHDFPNREVFEQAIVTSLQQHGTELVCLAGYMRIVGKPILAAFPNRVLNIHPALLPAFPGLNAPAQALEYGVKVSGCTVHIVDEKIDHGPILCQAAVDIRDGDTIETLAARIREQEHRLYPQAITLFAHKGGIL